MFVDTTINGRMECTSAASGGTLYLYMPYKAKIADVQGVVQGSVSSSSFSVAVTAPSTSSVSSVGTLAFSGSTSLAAKAIGTYTKDASSGSSTLSAGDVLQLTVDSGGVTGSFGIEFTVSLNPYAN